MSDAAPAASDTVLTAAAPAPAEAPAAAPASAPAAAPVAPAEPSSLLTDEPAAKPTEEAKPELTDAEKAEAEKAAKEAEKPQGAPEQYEDFKLPENFQADAAVLDGFKVIAKDLGLTQEAAQKLVDFQTAQAVKNAQGYGTALQTHVDTVAKEWATTAQADPEIGGAKFAENVAVAKQALDTFGTPELKTLLKESRIGNHPEVIRLLFKAGKAISQDGYVPGRAASAAKDTASTLYGTTK